MLYLQYFINRRSEVTIWHKQGIGDVLGILSFVIGGFIAAYFAKERKMAFGIYEGIFIVVITSLVSIGVPSASFMIFCNCV